MNKHLEEFLGAELVAEFERLSPDNQKRALRAFRAIVEIYTLAEGSERFDSISDDIDAIIKRENRILDDIEAILRRMQDDLELESI